MYGNAFITLAAVHAVDSSKGLFSEMLESYQSFQISSISTGRHETAVHARRRLPELHSWPSYESMKTPLYQRAWTYQERLVSKRVVHFTKEELLWECCEGVGCECLANASARPRRSDDPQYFGWVRCPKIKHSEAIQMGNPIRRWHEIVEEYSQLDLSFKSDRLPAISALARQIHALRPNDRYMAGCWMNTIGQDLLWITASERMTPARDSSAPSWSWASILGGVHYYKPIHGQVLYTYYLKLVNAVCDSVSGDN